MSKVSRITQQQDARGANTKDITTDRISRSEAFLSYTENLAVAEDATVELLFRPDPNFTIPQLTIGGSVGADAEVALFENPTVSADGSALPRIDRNRKTKAEPFSFVFENPTVTDPGFTLLDVFVPGGEGRRESPGSAALRPLHWLLDEELDYLIRFTNKAGGGGTQPMLIQIDWVEVPKGGP